MASPNTERSEPIHDFLYFLEQHVGDTFEYSDSKVCMFMDIALAHGIEPYGLQSERGKRIFDAAVFGSNKYGTPEELISEFGRLTGLLRKTQSFSLRVFGYASKIFADNGDFEADFRFQFMLNEWQKKTLEYLRTEISAIAGSIFDVLRDSRKPESRWYSSVINPDRSEADIEHEKREQPYYTAGF